MSTLKISLEAARVNARLKQKDAAKLIGVSAQTLLNWEKGHTSPDLEKALKLCEVYGVEIDNLIFFNQQSNKIERAI